MREALGDAVEDFDAVAEPVVVLLSPARLVAVGASRVGVAAPPVCDAHSDAEAEGERDGFGEPEPVLVAHGEADAEAHVEGDEVGRGERVDVAERVLCVEGRGEGVPEGEPVPVGVARELLVARGVAVPLTERVPGSLVGDAPTVLLVEGAAERVTEAHEEVEGDARGERLPDTVTVAQTERRAEADSDVDAEGDFDADVELVVVRDNAGEREGGGEWVAERLPRSASEGRGEDVTERLARGDAEPEGERGGERESAPDFVAIEVPEAEVEARDEGVGVREEAVDFEGGALRVTEGGGVGRTEVVTEPVPRAVLLDVPLVEPLPVARREVEALRVTRALCEEVGERAAVRVAPGVSETEPLRFPEREGSGEDVTVLQGGESGEGVGAKKRDGGGGGKRGGAGGFIRPPRK